MKESISFLILCGLLYFCIRAAWVVGQMVYQQWNDHD